MLTETEARAKAAAFEQLLEEKGITNCEIRVWENLGWHYAATHPSFSLHEAYDCEDATRYWALFGGPDMGDLELNPVPMPRFACPRKCLEYCLTYVEDYTQNVTARLQAARRSLGDVDNGG